MLKVMTYNIQHGIDHLHRLKTNEMVVDLDQIIKIIQTINPDVLTLNEVYNAPEFGNQAKYIATKLGYHYQFGKAINIRGGEYGNALLSKFPLQNVCVIPIPDATNKEENVFYESRSIIKAKIVVNNTCFNLLSTHFGLAREEQTNGTKVICDLSKDLQNIIFMGDLNLTPKNINFKTLCENFNNTIDLEKFSFRSDNPTSRIDYIFTSKNLIYENGQVLDIVYTDHLPLIVNIKEE